MYVIVKGDAVVDNTKLNKEYLLSIVSRLIRYIILMNAPDSDTILSQEMDFNISNEPFHYIATFNNVEDDDQGVTHRYEHILKISRRNADCEYTMNDYIKVIDTYEEPTDRIIGKVWDGATVSGRPRLVDLTKHFEAGDEIVLKYAEYGTDYHVHLQYRDSNHDVHPYDRDFVKNELYVNYILYDHTIYDEDGTVIHAQGDVMLDENDQVMWEYVPVDKQFHWQLVNTVHDEIDSSNHLQEPLD